MTFSEDEIFTKIVSDHDDSLLVAATREGSLFLYSKQ